MEHTHQQIHEHHSIYRQRTKYGAKHRAENMRHYRHDCKGWRRRKAERIGYIKAGSSR